MTNPTGEGLSADAELVAYLDGELGPAERASLEARLAADPSLRARLAELAAGGRAFKEAFAPLLDAAPRAELEAQLAAMVARNDTGLPVASRPRRWALAAVAALVMFAAGIAVDRFGPSLVSTPMERTAESPEDWREAVAEYLALYTTDTLAGVPDDAAQRSRELEQLSEKLGIRLTADRIALPNLAFKRAQLFDYDEKPLGQVAYLDPGSGPVALCVIADGESDRAPAAERRSGMNIVYWANAGRGFMLIGRLPTSQLEAMAETIRARLS